MEKVADHYAFVDISDYGRPLARWLVGRIQHTAITPIHLTLTYTVVGTVAAVMIASHRWLPVAGGLLLLKSSLDAADGALARARGRPSRTGRFLDSVCDFWVNLAVYLAIAVDGWSRSGQVGYFLLAGSALVSAMLQVSVYNYFSVRYRAQTGGDLTSRVDEGAPGGYDGDDPIRLRTLHSLYKWIYGWQDSLVARLDLLLAPAQPPLRPAFLSATSVLGLGTQLLIVALLAAAGRPDAALWLFVTALNLYMLAIFVARGWTKPTRARDGAEPERSSGAGRRRVDRSRKRQ